MDNPGSTCREFYDIIKALERNNSNEAFDILKNNVAKLVHATDERNGYVEERYQYKYRLFERQGLTLLHYAAIYDQPRMVKLLILHKADPLKEEKGRAKNNPFHYACIFANEETMKELLSSEQCELLVNKGNYFSWRPLYYISERKDLKLMRLILNYGADPNGKAEATLRNSVLQFATKYSSLSCVSELLKNPRVEVNFCDGIKGQTALHMACEDDKPDILKLLLEKNADITITDSEGRTALQVAICNNAEKCAEILVEKHALTLKNGLKFLMEAIDRPKIVRNIVTRHTEEFGHHSIKLKKENEEDMVDILHRIVKSEAYSDEDFKEVATKLGKNCIEDEDMNGRTPIMIAAMLNKHRRLVILLDVYTKILTDCLYTPEKSYYSELYTNLIGKTDKQGYAAVHLAVTCDGPDVDFEDTVKVLNTLRSLIV